ncbi:ABC transporter permease [Pseudonocardia ailaonensis]|uniref:ABC transporter permease n=1 Tax=Pseudonocardia ailaonensis TaxID=367279 RepID=A0ABN2NJW8_9PSEU
MSRSTVAMERGDAGSADVRRATVRRPSIRALALPLTFVALTVIGAILTPGFSTAANYRAVMLSAATTGIVAVSMTLVTMSGNFISLACSQSAMVAALGFAGLVGAGVPWPIAVVVVVIGMALIGAFQGVAIAMGLDPIITTIAAGAVMLGAAAAVSNGAQVTFDRVLTPFLSSVQPLGIPLPIYVFVLVSAALGWLAHATALGRRILLVGANRAAAHLSGLSAQRVTVVVFVVFSIGTGIAAILAIAPVGGGDTTFAAPLTIDVAAAVIVGGTILHGGRGSPLRSALGAVIVATIDNLMILNGFSFGERQVAKGVVVVIVVVTIIVLERGGRR